MTAKYQTQAEIRRVFVRHWIDLDGLTFGCHRETVRVAGALRPSGGRPLPIDAAFLDNLENELCRIGDVRRVHFELKNWRRDASGSWRCLAAAQDAKAEDAARTEPEGLAGLEGLELPALEPFVLA